MYNTWLETPVDHLAELRISMIHQDSGHMQGRKYLVTQYSALQVETNVY